MKNVVRKKIKSAKGCERKSASILTYQKKTVQKDIEIYKENSNK